MRKFTCKRSNVKFINQCKPYNRLNDFYVANKCTENMHGTNIFIPGCKWYLNKKRIRTKDTPSVFQRKHLHFKTKKRRYVYK